ncbi:lipase class 3 family protein [Zea mays]|uniref:Lipase class 3 family protein n=1 Tax=Zea mays TaxID=4577 RepID=A0A1D6H8A0_MAIZE|nr:lipase class 3 family protein [Zea mays]
MLSLATRHATDTVQDLAPNVAPEQNDTQKGEENHGKSYRETSKKLRKKPKPVVHRVAVLATLANLRVIATTPSKEDNRLHVKCITFSQPPVGNAALRELF